jgi:plastocyanin
MRTDRSAGTRSFARAGHLLPLARIPVRWKTAAMRMPTVAPIALAGLLLVAGCGVGHRPVLHHVTIARVAYDPAKLSVAVGDTVEWTNQDLVPHTATARSGHWNSVPMQPGDSWRTVMTTRGVEPYGCLYHPTMGATLEVR